MKSDCRYLFPESWNLWKVTSIGSDFLSPASFEINSPFFKYTLPMTPKIHKKKIIFLSSFWCQNRVSKIAFFWFFFNWKNWHVIFFNINQSLKLWSLTLFFYTKYFRSDAWVLTGVTKNEFPLSIRRQSAILNRVVYSMTGVISISGIFSGLPGREFNLFQVKLTHDCCTFALHKDTFSSGRRKIFDWSNKF